jgi:hypothetical protein
MFGLILATALASAPFLKMSVDVQEFGIHGSGIILVDRAKGRYVRTFLAGPASDSEGYDGHLAWLADATNASYIQGDSDAKEAIIGWSNLYSRFGSTLMPTAVQVRRSPGAEHATFSNFHCIEKSFCPPFTISITSEEGTRSVSVRKIEALDRVPSGAFAPTHARDDAAISSGAPVAVVQILPETYGGHILSLTIMGVSFDGSRPLRLLLDSGGQNVLTPSAAQQLGLRTYGSVQVGGAGAGTISASFAWVNRMQIGDATLQHQPFLILPLAGILPDIDGIVGAELLSRFVTRIDFRSNTVEFAKVAPPSWTLDSVGTPIAFSDTAPTLAGAVDGFPGTFLLDTGAAGSVDINAPFSLRNGLFERYRGNNASGLNGVGGNVQVTNVTIGQFELGRCFLTRVPATLAHAGGGASASSSIAGVVGQILLRKFDSMVMDYAKRQVSLGSSGTATCEPRGA